MREWLEENLIYVLVGALGIAVLIGVIVFFANYEPLTEGIVIDKYYEPAHSERYTTYITVDGKQQGIPGYRHVGDKFILIVQNGENKDLWYVSEEFYNSVHAGDWVRK